MMYGWGHMIGFGGLFMGFWMIAFWIIIIAGAIFAVRALSAPMGSNTGGTRALEVLKERYARGEIDTAEYENKRRDLER